MPPFALGDLSNRHPQYQNQYTLVNKSGWLGFAAVSRRVLALPPELLAEIFLCCLPEPGCITITDGTPDPNTPPLVFCAVCRHWREVALTTPGLWGTLYLDAEFAYSKAQGDEYVEFCRQWISRAGDTPLTFWLEAFVKDDNIRSLHNLLGRLARNWRSAYLSRDSHMPNWLQLPSHGKYPFLEDLTFATACSDPAISFCDAPRLRAVCLYGFTTNIRLPWHQLTTFQTDNIDVSACLKVLRDASKLVEASFAWIENDHSPSLSNATIPLLNLKSLKLGQESASAETFPMGILDSLKAPALKSLTLQSIEHNHTPASNISPFLSFISRSSCQLHTLKLRLIPMSTAALIECLEATPSLRNLKLQPMWPVNSKAIFTQFTRRPEFLPVLESFYLVFPNSGMLVSSATASLVVDMLTWRRSATPLHSFHLAHPYPEHWFGTAIEAHPEFRRLRKEGMRLYVGKWWGDESFMHDDLFIY
ncbi:hypothetical protein C8F04DRAFT_1132180 [Mycena alexandri]|uniref:F-box domain-containing protein n=1 Tax=Mycena alexandri TaxID=1745969 RepID=A0AAD6SCA5_9AGAR|nr:hypothetical protein C8F04DRAFT_1132180 [Mycena alexandri]